MPEPSTAFGSVATSMGRPIGISHQIFKTPENIENAVVFTAPESYDPSDPTQPLVVD